MNYEQAEAMAIKAAKQAIVYNYDAARAQLTTTTGLFGKELDRKARKLALKMGGFVLPDGWTISMVTPDEWGQGASGYRGQTSKDMRP